MSLVWPGPSTNPESNPENHLVSARSPLAWPFTISRGYWGPICHQEAPSWVPTIDNHRAYMNGLVWSLLSTCSTFLLCSIVANSTPHFQVLVTNGETVPLGCHAVCHLLLYVNMDLTRWTWSPLCQSEGSYFCCSVDQQVPVLPHYPLLFVKVGKVVSEDSLTSHTCIVMICHSWDLPRSASLTV